MKGVTFWLKGRPESDSLTMESETVQTCEEFKWSSCPLRCDLCVPCEVDINCQLCKPVQKTNILVNDCGNPTPDFMEQSCLDNNTEAEPPVIQEPLEGEKWSILRWIGKLLQILTFFWCFLSVVAIVACLKLLKFQIILFRTFNYWILLSVNGLFLCATKLGNVVEYYEISLTRTDAVRKIFITLRTLLASKKLRSALKKILLVGVKLARIIVLIARKVMLSGVKQCERLVRIFEISYYILSGRMNWNRAASRNSWWIQIPNGMTKAVNSVVTYFLKTSRRIVRYLAVIVKHSIDFFL